jgi:ATP-dependent DNA helicase RecG
VYRKDFGHFLSELSLIQELSFEYAEKVFDEKGILFKEEQKKSLGLIMNDNRYSNLGLILSDQCPYSTKAAIFEGRNKSIFKDRKEFSGSLFKQIDEVMSYLNVYNKTRSTFEGAYRIDYPDYPEIALREAFINALIHRDYYLEGSVLASLFDDRLEIMSLGGLMPGVTRDLMATGVSVTRNEKLAQIFYRLKIIEAYGTGIPRILSVYDDVFVKPELPITEGGFLIQLPNKNYHAGTLPDLNEKEQILYETFKDKKFDREEAAKILGLSAGGAYKIITKLEKSGVLSSTKSGRKIIYRFV